MSRTEQQRAAEVSDTHQLPLFDDQKAPSPIAGHSGLPVAGYEKKVDQWKIDMVNNNKAIEEQILRNVDTHAALAAEGKIDGASVQLARRHFEDAFYRLNRAIMQPKRLLGNLA